MEARKRGPGKFIAIEGQDGVGKTTMAEILQHELSEKLTRHGYRIVKIRTPGGNPISEKLREVLIDKTNTLCKETELLLFAASHKETLEKVIYPLLQDPKTIVICDRHIDSLYAYQGYGRLMVPKVHRIHADYLDAFSPDETIYATADTVLIEERLSVRGELDRFESEEDAFKRRLLYGFLMMSTSRRRTSPDAVSCVLNNGTVAEMHKQLNQWADKFCAKLLPKEL